MASGRADDPQAVIAGRRAAEQCRDQLQGWPPRLLLPFVAPDLDHDAVLRGIGEVFGAAPRIGCTTAAAYTRDGSAGVALTALAGADLRVRTGSGSHHGDEVTRAAAQATLSFARRADGDLDPRWTGRTLLVFVAGRADSDALLHELRARTGAHYQVFGGLAAGERRRAAVFAGDRALRSGFACAEILSARPFRVAQGHGFAPVGAALRVSAARGPWLQQLDDRPAWTVVQEQLGRAAAATASPDALPADLLLGVRRGPGHELRVPLQRREDGSLRLSQPVLPGDVVQCMRADRDRMLDAGQQAVQAAVQEGRGEGAARWAGALVVECPTTQGVLGPAFADHVDRTLQALEARAVAIGTVQGGFASCDGAVLAPCDAGSLVCLVPA
ncbi:MAG: FIST signal transduction protein [Planctomycetota bacterium]